MNAAIIVLALCAVTAYAQNGQRSGRMMGMMACPTNLGVTQAQCDSMKTCMQSAMSSMSKPTAGTKPTQAQMTQMRTQMQQTMSSCATQAGISAAIQAQMQASHPMPSNGMQSMQQQG